MISGLIERLYTGSRPATLKSVTALCTSLILVRKLLSADDSTQALLYNKANAVSTIRDLKADGRVFKALADLMKTLNPLAVEGNIIHPLLVPLLERMTFPEECKKDAECDAENLLGEEAEESEEVAGEGEGMSDGDDGPAIEIEIEIDAEDPHEEAEEDESEGEGDSEESADEPFVEENATESDNLSLDDMIEELEYGEGDDDGSDEGGSEGDPEDDSDDGNLRSNQIEDIDDLDEDDQDDDSDDASELVAGEDGAALMELVDEPGDDEVDELESVPVQNDDEAVDAFNIIEVEENNEEGSNLLPGDRLLDLQQIEGILTIL